MIRNIVKMISTAAVALLVSSSANAALLDGKTIGYEYLFPTVNDSNPWYGAGTYVVGAGLEANDGSIATDFSDTNVTIDYNFTAMWCGCGQSFNGVHYFDALGTIADFTSVTLNGLTNLVGLSQANITFDANNIWIDWQNLSFDTNTLVSIDIEGASANVPESSSLLLLVIGLMMTVVIRRRRA
jgi:hypothetical protein